MNIEIPESENVVTKGPVEFPLSTEQLTGLVTLISGSGVTLPAGITNLNLRMCDDGSGVVTLRFT